MIRRVRLQQYGVLALLSVVLASVCCNVVGANSTLPGDSRPAPVSHIVEQAAQAAQSDETRYLAFQIFTSSPDPKIAESGQGMRPLTGLPERAALRDYIADIKQRIGTVGSGTTRLAVMLGPISFDHSDTEVSRFIAMAMDLGIEMNVAIGFHIDDSMFWSKRKDLWSNPANVEAMDWDGTPCTSRRLDWSREPSPAPPQMCFNSKAVEHEVKLRGALIGKAVSAGIARLKRLGRPELFAGVIAGSETMIGQDFATGRYLGYRAMINRGFSRQHPPKDMDAERESVVREFIDLWTASLASSGIPAAKLYSHTAFLSHRIFEGGDKPAASFSQHNHFAPPDVAFGPQHRPGFSTYPQPGLYDDIYHALAARHQIGWASSEGTNLQLGSAPGQSGINMETYLARMFNHGATLVTIFSWGIGGEANKNMDFRLVTEGTEAINAYRTFLKGAPLTENKTETVTLMERLPTKIHKIQRELPAWIAKTHRTEEAGPLMQELDGHLKANRFEEEKTADKLLKLISN